MKFLNNLRQKKNRKINYSYENKIRNYAQLSQEELLKDLDLEYYGLSNTDAAYRISKYGYNEVDRRKYQWVLEFFKSYFSPFNLILTAITIYNLYTYFTSSDSTVYDLVGGIIVGFMVILSGTFTYVQSIRAYMISKKLLKYISKKALVIRNPQVKLKEVNMQTEFELIKDSYEIDTKDLVPGDLVYLATGDVVPADIRILCGTNLLVNQSSLTGESMPVHKTASYNNEDHVFESENICMMGTSIAYGSAIGIVLATGKNTYFSSISASINQIRPQTSFEKGIKRVTFLLIMFMIVMVPIVLVINGLTKNDWTGALLFAVSVAVGLTPEMLPMIVTSNLARGSAKMNKHKIITKNLSSIQNLGAIDVLCTDKTGTITNDNIELVDYRTIDNKNNEELLEKLYLNSYYQTGIKNPLDKAIVNYVNDRKVNIPVNVYQKIHEIPFDFNRRKLSVILKNAYDGTIVITKGAAEEVLSTCKKAVYNNQIVEIDESIARQIKSLVKSLNEQGLRVIALAFKELIPDPDSDDFIDNAEEDLVFAGFASFLDTPKISAAHMVKELKRHGVALKILTGDNEEVTRAICKRINLNIEGVVSGTALENVTPEELRSIVEVNNIFVKLTPFQKAMIIKALRENNHVVGYMGDGINDALVLRESDVGVSVDNATDLVKDAADLILLEKSLHSVVNGIIEGRHVFGNILKYIKITIASNFGNVFSVLVASAWLPFTPMQPVQMLFQNLIYDMSQFAVAFDRVDETFLMRPQRWTTKNFLPFAFVNGPVSSIFDITTFLVLWFVYGVGKNPSDPNQIAVFNASWFIEGLITQTLVVQMFRTEKIPFIQSRATWPVNITTLAVVVLGFAIPYSPLGNKLKMEQPAFSYIGIVILIILSYCLLSQFIKVLYIRTFKKWL